MGQRLRFLEAEHQDQKQELVSPTTTDHDATHDEPYGDGDPVYTTEDSEQMGEKEAGRPEEDGLGHEVATGQPDEQNEWPKEGQARRRRRRRRAQGAPGGRQ